MEQIEKLKCGKVLLERCCRTCLTHAPQQMHEIFGDADVLEELTFDQLLSHCTSLNVDKDDRLPKKVCGNCYNCLIGFFKFRQLAERIDSQLRDFDESENNKSKPDNLMFDIKIEDESTKIEPNCDIGLINIEIENNIKQEKSFSTEDDGVEDFTFDDLEDVKVTFKCDVCYRVFSSSLMLEHHSARGSCCTSYSCTFCSRTFKRHHKLITHLLVHGVDVTKVEKNENDTISSLKCSICSVKYRSPNSLAAHMRKHTKKGRVLACSICGKIFKKISHVKRHELCHEENRPFKCSICPKRFNTEGLLNEHLNKHNKVKPHSCPMCNKSFAHLSTLSTHVKVHTRDKPYLCPTCGKKFDSSTNLNQHMRRHAGYKPFTCPLCPRSFVSKGELKSHSVCHSGARSWRCESCEATFAHRRALAHHTRRHAGDKPHACDTCPMRFLTKDHLKRHYRIHTGEKPYKCQYCERAFAQSNDLIKHTRSHLGQNLYQCSMCPARFRLQIELRRHQTTHFTTPPPADPS